MRLTPEELFTKFGPTSLVGHGANGEVSIRRRCDEVNVEIDGKCVYLDPSEAITLGAKLLDAAMQALVYDGTVRPDAYMAQFGGL